MSNMTATESKVRISGISYVIIRETENPAISGRYLVHLMRPNGAKRYVATRYEDGSYSGVVTNGFDHFADPSKMIAGGAP